MPIDVTGSRAKVQRAKEHFQDLAAQASAFMSLNPYGVVIEDNADTGERIWRARVSRPIPPEWSLIIGDIVHNLHSALDFLAWQLELANGRMPSMSTESRSIQFPVWDRGKARPTTAAAVREQKNARERQIRAFGQPAMALIEGLQPDSRRDRGKFALHPLWLLHKLDIEDKHRLLVVAGGTVRQAGLTIGGPGEHVHIDHLSLGSPEASIVPVADGAELMRLKLGDDTPDVQVKDKFASFVAFAKDGPGQGEPVLQTCHKLISFVDEALTLFAALP
jgi:hypothetical protein